VEKEQRYFEEPIGDYLALLGAVKEAVDRRNQVRKWKLEIETGGQRELEMV